MKFYVKELYLWKSAGLDPRVLKFEQNKINVITGGTGTGKTTIIHIINYCLLTSKPKIPTPHINDTINWYGLNFKINDKDFFIARERPDQFDSPSNKYYFSSIGEVPFYPIPNISEAELKLTLEREFGIEDNLVIPYGGKEIKSGSKVSFRYFLLMNTQHEDTIADSTTFFDFKIHEEARYKEAFDRIFDLILGVGSVEKVLLQQKLGELQRKIVAVLNKEKAMLKATEQVDLNILELVARAQSFELIDRRLLTPTEAKQELVKLIHDVKTDINISPLKEIEELKQRKTRVMLQMRNLESLERNAVIYKSFEGKDEDSLRPVGLIKQYFDSEIVKTFELKYLIDGLNENLLQVKQSIENRNSFIMNVQTEIEVLKREIVQINEQINSFPEDIDELRGEANKYIFIGELQTLLKLYEDASNETNGGLNLKKEDLERQITDIEAQLQDVQNSRMIQMSLLNEFINSTKHSVEDMLGSYKDYRAHFNIKEKSLELIPPGSATPASNIGSRSNHMYMHLIMIFGFHEHMMNNKNKYVPQFLIFDQPSQPYFETVQGNKVDTLTLEDRKKLQNAFKMMDKFITKAQSDYHTDFQIILLEHAREDQWEGLQNFNLVDDFWNGRALVM
jgi:energy-coupling factor transporter ATP-binding protein EcfA2